MNLPNVAAFCMFVADLSPGRFCSWWGRKPFLVQPICVLQVFNVHFKIHKLQQKEKVLTEGLSSPTVLPC